ncbi:PepSY domain-containing protein [Pedobacter sp. PAMC26386]|nr:PepSY domain-containing protein [Pedobacter sp. PAMC26386]
MNFKKVARLVHRWLGLTSGLVVFIVSVTGCLYVFQDEIKDATEPWRKVEVQQKPIILPSKLSEIAQKVHPDLEIGRIVYVSKDRAAIVFLTGKGAFYTVHINPYTGAVLHDQNLRKDFFTIVQFIHIYLLLPGPIGKMVVGVSVFIFLVLLITGVCIWWPKRKTQLKRSLTIKFNGKWRRVNYDLHSVLGIYACVIAFIVAFTGLSISYDWVKRGVKQTVNMGTQYASEEKIPTVKLIGLMNSDKLIDASFLESVKRSPNSDMYLIAPVAKGSAILNITVYEEALFYYKSDRYYFNANNGAVIKEVFHRNKSNGLKLNEMSYDLHTGQILGLTGKIIAFISSLVCATLPVTGFLFWRGKRKDKRRALAEKA